MKAADTGNAKSPTIRSSTHELKRCPLCSSATADRCTIVLQVESVQLASESAQKQLEAELAAAKRDAAQAAAAHKSTAASRQSELDWQIAEASRASLSSWLRLLPRAVRVVKACVHVAHASL